MTDQVAVIRIGTGVIVIAFLVLFACVLSVLFANKHESCIPEDDENKSE